MTKELQKAIMKRLPLKNTEITKTGIHIYTKKKFLYKPSKQKINELLQKR